MDSCRCFHIRGVYIHTGIFISESFISILFLPDIADFSIYIAMGAPLRLAAAPLSRVKSGDGRK